jgi:ABC-type branched-subunit amino acid transport system permease subunit
MADQFRFDHTPQAVWLHGQNQRHFGQAGDRRDLIQGKAGGALYAQYFLYLDPTQVISAEISFQFALLPAVGGLGTAIGPVLGSFAITPLSEFLRSYLGGAASGLHLAVYGGVVILVVLYFPGGIAGALQRLAHHRDDTR